ncbi:hypothetical protein CDD83_749 [Cordyceps sp. RAO-2017]|nr:hypothetical protein CDD83_749 [Cordyceps sp. RAO-2017]
MYRSGAVVKSRSDTKTPVRLTRLRSRLAGAPSVLKGLDDNNRPVEALPQDPENIPFGEVRYRLPRSHPLAKRRIKIILHPSRQRPSPEPEKAAVPRRPIIIIKRRQRCIKVETAGDDQSVLKTAPSPPMGPDLIPSSSYTIPTCLRTPNFLQTRANRPLDSPNISPRTVVDPSGSSSLADQIRNHEESGLDIHPMAAQQYSYRRSTAGTW